MRISTLPAFLLPSLSACHVVYPQPRAQPAEAPSAAIIPLATPTSTLGRNTQLPAPTSSFVLVEEHLDLRQVAPANPNQPAQPAGHDAPNDNPVPPADPAPAIPNEVTPGKPAPAPAPAPADPAPANPNERLIGESTTVQWVETMKEGIRTWVPVTVTFTFATVPSQLAQPGKGVIGMGTLTGEAGRTRTVEMGAAATVGAGWKGFAVGVGVGVVGLVV